MIIIKHGNENERGEVRLITPIVQMTSQPVLPERTFFGACAKIEMTVMYLW